MKILLGDTENFVNQIRKKESWKRILAPKRGAEWTLEKVDDDLFWILNDSIKSLKDQFMIFKNGEFLLFFNYRGNQPPQEFLDHWGQMILNDLTSKQKENSKVVVVGINYRDQTKIDKQNKKNILKWCIDFENQQSCDYIEFDQLLHDIIQN